MERDSLMQLLAGDDEASLAALAALHSGATYVVWDEASPSQSYAHVYARRLRHTRRKGVETVGLEQAVQRLGEHDRPVRLGQVAAADKSWVFMLFLTEDGGSLVACTGVRKAVE
ncbi:hypothetical protein [Streptomyces sp. NBC_01361]|uniref:hypothetical protein n=1 Tax=Streptomyces sp. NBC_01361 TaxID=2903838 RepID=UPI002E363C73|nr:hypothetical protein [Streptomyces sp. NBC_01361]